MPLKLIITASLCTLAIMTAISKPAYATSTAGYDNLVMTVANILGVLFFCTALKILLSVRKAKIKGTKEKIEAMACMGLALLCLSVPFAMHYYDQPVLPENAKDTGKTNPR